MGLKPWAIRFVAEEVFPFQMDRSASTAIAAVAPSSLLDFSACSDTVLFLIGLGLGWGCSLAEFEVMVCEFSLSVTTFCAKSLSLVMSKG